MLKPLSSRDDIGEIIARRDCVAASPNHLSKAWLSGGPRVALPEEAGRHLEPDECDRLARALTLAGVHELVAITNDPLVDDDLVFGLASHEDDLAAFSWEFSGLGALLLPRIGTDLAVLGSVDDFHLIAGPRKFVTDYAGNLKAARAEFLKYSERHFDIMRPILREAVQYMDWIESSA